MTREGAGKRLAYADPPYIGQAKKHYGNEPTYAGEVDHAALIKQLCEYDGWALSLSSPTLAQVLALAPEGVRVAAWVKPFASFKPGVNPAYAWEPVLFVPGRSGSREIPTVRDWLSCSITLKRGLAGVKPSAFNHWILDLLGWEKGDTVDDLFPGSGGMSECVATRERYFEPIQGIIS